MTTPISDLLRGRQVLLPLTNKSGGEVVAGDVVILDSSNAGAFKTTDTAGQSDDWVGVAVETIANNAAGRVCFSGYVPIINLASSASLGDYVKTHSVAKQGTPTGTLPTGAFGQVLGTGTTPSAVVWGRPYISPSIPDPSNLVTNGTFDSVTTGWNVTGTPSLSISSGQMVINRNGSGYSDILCYQDVTVESGKYYLIGFDYIARGSGAVTAGFFVTDNSVLHRLVNGGTPPFRHMSLHLAASTTLRISFAVAEDASGTITIDNVFVIKIK